MAHELTIREDGYTEMAFVGDTPWHGLGQELNKGADMATWKKAAGMDWDIMASPVKFEVGDCNREIEDIEFPSQNVLYRSDNNMPLSIVSDKYKPVQPSEVLDFFDSLVKEAGFRLHTAGTLRGGKRLWALAETGRFGEVCKDDGVGGFLLLSTSCDKTLATTARFTTVRVVCNNTLTMAHSHAKTLVSVPHSTVFDHDKVKNQLGMASEAFGSFMEMAKHLQKQQMLSLSADNFIKKLVEPLNQVKKEEYEIGKNRTYKAIWELFEGGAKGSELTGHTKWAMLNAVTEYYDHHFPSRSTDSRLDKAWYGIGDRTKQRAVELLMAD
jgi:phage/plasmid-like protein (TIGR03299 family)